MGRSVRSTDALEPTRHSYEDEPKGGIPLPMASFGVGGEFGIGGKYDNGERFDLRLPYVDQGWTEEADEENNEQAAPPRDTAQRKPIDTAPLAICFRTACSGRLLRELDEWWPPPEGGGRALAAEGPEAQVVKYHQRKACRYARSGANVEQAGAPGPSTPGLGRFGSR